MIKVRKFYDFIDKCFKFYSIHGDGEYFDTYDEAYRDELIGLGILIP